MAKQRGLFESKQEVMLAVTSCVMVVVVILSASIRHSVLCESGLAEDTETGSQLARQSLDARLLSVEQEAIENTILIQRVLKLLSDKHPDREAFSFEELYPTAEKLAVEIDAAFDRFDDDLFSKPRVPADEPPADDKATNEIRLDDRTPEIEARLPHDDATDPLGADDPAERCSDLATRFDIVPQISWGRAPSDIQTEWRTLNCDHHNL